MKSKLQFIPIFLTTLWIGFSEFLRNQLILNKAWSNHYEKLGIDFPSRPLNGAVWMLWSFLFACYIYALSKKFNLKETFLLSWWAGFLLMWLVIGNLNVLPINILWLALPLSLLEAFIASWIIFRYNKK